MPKGCVGPPISIRENKRLLCVQLAPGPATRLLLSGKLLLQ